MFYYWFIADNVESNFYVEKTETPIAPRIGAVQLTEHQYEDYKRNALYLVADRSGLPMLDFNTPVEPQYCHWDQATQQWHQDEEELAIMLQDKKIEILEDVKLYALADLDKQAKNTVSTFFCEQAVNRELIADAKRLLKDKQELAADSLLMQFTKLHKLDPKEYAADVLKNHKTLLTYGLACKYFLAFVRDDLDENYKDPTNYQYTQQLKEKYRAYTPEAILSIYLEQLDKAKEKEEQQEEEQAKETKKKAKAKTAKAS